MQLQQLEHMNGAGPAPAVAQAKGATRRAVPRDAVNILRCIEPMLSEMAYQLPPIQDGHALHWILGCIERGIVTVAVHDGRVIGSLGTVMQCWPWNQDLPYLTNTWFYVRPEWRPRGVAIGLLRQFFEEYKMVEIEPRPPLHFTINSGVDIELKEKLLSRYGFINCGAVMTIGAPRQNNGNGHHV